RAASGRPGPRGSPIFCPRVKPNMTTPRDKTDRRIWVLAVSPKGATSVPLDPGQDLWVGSGAGANLVLADPELPELAMGLRVLEDGRVELRPAEGQAPLVNEVQFTRSSLARAGDWVRIGQSAILILAISPRQAQRPRVRSLEEFAQ